KRELHEIVAGFDLGRPVRVDLSKELERASRRLDQEGVVRGRVERTKGSFGARLAEGDLADRAECGRLRRAPEHLRDSLADGDGADARALLRAEVACEPSARFSRLSALAVLDAILHHEVRAARIVATDGLMKSEPSFAEQ